MLIFSACYTEKKAMRHLRQIKERQPHLIQADTAKKKVIFDEWFGVAVPGDTVTNKSEWFWSMNEVDTFERVLIDSIATTQVKLINADTVVEIKVRTIVQERLVPVRITDTIEVSIPEINYITNTKKYIPWWVYVVIGIMAVVIILQLFAINKTAR